MALTTYIWHRSLTKPAACSCLTLKTRCGWSFRTSTTNADRISSMRLSPAWCQICQHSRRRVMTATLQITLSEERRSNSWPEQPSTLKMLSEVAASNSTWTVKNEDSHIDAWNPVAADFHKGEWCGSPMGEVFKWTNQESQKHTLRFQL